MLSYLSAESNFIRAFGNRSLILILLCALSRTGIGYGKETVLYLPLNLNPALIVIVGPILALLFLISLKIEADSLRLAREAVLADFANLTLAKKVSPWVYPLFAMPSLAALYMTVQLLVKLVPAQPDACQRWSLSHQFFDTSFPRGAPAIYCIGNLDAGVWVYPPCETYAYVVCVVICSYLSYQIAKQWSQLRAIC